jgi:hypothetical protein
MAAANDTLRNAPAEFLDTKVPNEFARSSPSHSRVAGINTLRIPNKAIADPNTVKTTNKMGYVPLRANVALPTQTNNAARNRLPAAARVVDGSTLTANFRLASGTESQPQLGLCAESCSEVGS